MSQTKGSHCFHEMKWLKIPKANSKNVSSKSLKYFFLIIKNLIILLICWLFQKAPVIDFESLITQKQLGEGYYSDVYLAATQDKTVIAVKVLKGINFSLKERNNRMLTQNCVLLQKSLIWKGISKEK